MKKFSVTFLNSHSQAALESHHEIEAEDFKQAFSKIAIDDAGYLADEDLISVKIEEIKTKKTRTI